MTKFINNPFYQLQEEPIDTPLTHLNPFSTSKDITALLMSKISKHSPHKPQQQDQFIIMSSQVRFRLVQANQRLKQFQLIASQTGLFNDQDHKLNNILQLTKQDLDWAHSIIESLFKDSVNELYKSIAEVLQRQAIQLSNLFKKVLQDHTERVKNQEEKRSKFEGNRDRLIRRARGDLINGQKLFQQLSQIQTKREPTDQSQQSNGSHQTIIMQESKQQQQNKVIQMRKIEGMLNDVAVVFQRLGTMVKMQETMIDRIDKYTEDSVHNVRKGRKELQEAYKKASGSRSLILKVFLILFIFSIVYIVFVI